MGSRERVKNCPRPSFPCCSIYSRDDRANATLASVDGWTAKIRKPSIPEGGLEGLLEGACGAKAALIVLGNRGALHLVALVQEGQAKSKRQISTENLGILRPCDNRAR